MYSYLRGMLARKTPGFAVVDVGGVGYRVHIPLSTFYELGDEGGEVTLRVTMQVREDAILLYGFLTAAEQELFQHLVAVSGVGPKMAVGILSGMSVPELMAALAEADTGRLQTIPGVGRRTAERLVVELRDRARQLVAGAETLAGRPAPGGVRDDVISALVNLGYPARRAEKVAGQVLAEVGEGTAFEEVLRGALRGLHG